MQENMLRLENLMTPETLANPYPVYEELRATDPVHWNPLFGFWMLLRYDDILSAMQDSRISSAWGRHYAFPRPLSPDEQHYMEIIRPFLAQQMQAMDDPDHARQRGLVNKAFTPRMIENMRPRIQEVVDDLLDKVAASGQIELVSQFSYPLPITIILEILGIGQDGYAHLQRSANALLAFLNIIDPTVEALKPIADDLVSMEAYLTPLIAERRRQPGEDLLSKLVVAEESGQMLSEKEIVVLANILLFTGHETTTHLISNCILSLLRNPDQLELLKSQPDLIANAIEELLRYDSSVQFVPPRIVAQDFEFGGKMLHRGQRLMLCYGAANRDPEHYNEPNKLDLTRNIKRQLGFGYGVHYCLGAPLARLEAQTAVSTILRRLPNLRLASEALSWRPSFTVHGLQELPLAFDPQ